VDSGPALSGAHRRRGHKRQRAFEEKGHAGRTSSLHQHVKPAVTTAVPLPAFNTTTLPVAAGAYGAKVEYASEKYGGKKRRTLAELLAVGFQLIRWDGIAPRPLFDSQGRIFLVLAGRPVADGYAAAATRAYEFMKTMGTAAGFSASMRHHRRGLFAAINVGLTYGKGQDAPTWLDNKHHTRLAEDLLANKDLARMASFASCASDSAPPPP
jgi:hypothetical protein